MLAPRSLIATAALAALLLTGCTRQESVSAFTYHDAGSADDLQLAAAPAPQQAPRVAAIGQPAPDFTLKDVGGNSFTLSEFTHAGKTVVLEWFNPDCPVSKAYHVPEHLMAPVADEFASRDVVWLAINSGGPGLQGNGLQRNQRAVEEYAIPYPVLLDESGAVGKRYDAKRTPHMFVIDADGVLRYEGAIDDGDARTPGKLNYVRQALDELLAGKPVSVPRTTAFGCGVKYAKTAE
jgi:peroxiredoxin